MIAQFPLPYPDELLYSRVCRYHIRSGNACVSHTSLELYGQRHTHPHFEYFNVFTDEALRWVCRQKSLSDVIMTETMYPVHCRFYSRKCREMRLLFLATGRPLASQQKRYALRYCPQCAVEDREQYGETYWRRAHQIPHIDVCPTHGCRLVECNEVLDAWKSPKYFDAETLARKESSPMGSKTEIRLARYAAAVMNAPLPKDDTLHPAEYFQERLVGKGGDVRLWLRDNVVRLYDEYVAHFAGVDVFELGAFADLLEGTRVSFLFFCQMGEFLQIAPPE